MTNQPDHIVDMHEMVTDTNQASELFELCKQVYEATGWKDTHGRLDDGNHTIRNEGNEVLLGTKQVPLYTSDYLLEKLPVNGDVGEDIGYLVVVKEDIDSYQVSYDYGKVGDFMEISDTPLKALLKLTIALSEAGEFK